MRSTGRLIATTASINRVPSSTVLMRHYRYCCTVQAPAQTQFRIFSPIESSPKAMDCLVLMRNTGPLIATTASINRPILNRAHETLSVLLHSAGTRSNSISSLLTDRVFTEGHGLFGTDAEYRASTSTAASDSTAASETLPVLLHSAGTSHQLLQHDFAPENCNSRYAIRQARSSKSNSLRPLLQ
jgi:hypothetical protein